MPRKPQEPARLNMPPWLKPKLGHLLSGAENRKSFFERIALIYPPMDARYKLIERAYDAAKVAFRDQKRDDGVRYFEHLRATTLFLIVHLRVRDANQIAAMLLHDLVEDCRQQGWTLERVAREFGDEVARLVYWVTKPELSRAYPTKQEVDRKYYRMLRDAPREAVMLKLCDRLHNLITMWKQGRERMEAKVLETHYVIIPLAEKFQILIHELEDTLRLVEKRCCL